MAWKDGLTEWLHHPATMMGLGMLGASGRGVPSGQAIGRGGLMGLRQMRRNALVDIERQQWAAEQEALRQQQEAALAQQQYQAQQAQNLQSMLPPRLQGLAAAGYPDKAVELAFPKPEKVDLSGAAKVARDLGLKPGTEAWNQVVRQVAMKPVSKTVLQQFPQPPSGYHYVNPANPAEGLAVTPGGPGEKQTEGQLMSEGYASRMLEAAADLAALEVEGFAQSDITEYGPAALTNYFASEDYQLFDASKQDWVRAKIRRESGAVIGDDEMAKEIRTYFPVPGDKPPTIARKQRLRRTAEEAMAKAAGPAYFRRWKQLRAEQDKQLAQLKAQAVKAKKQAKKQRRAGGTGGFKVIEVK